MNYLIKGAIGVCATLVIAGCQPTQPPPPAPAPSRAEAPPAPTPPKAEAPPVRSTASHCTKTDTRGRCVECTFDLTAATVEGRERLAVVVGVPGPNFRMPDGVSKLNDGFQYKCSNMPVGRRVTARLNATFTIEGAAKPATVHVNLGGGPECGNIAHQAGEFRMDEPVAPLLYSGRTVGTRTASCNISINAHRWTAATDSSANAWRTVRATGNSILTISAR